LSQELADTKQKLVLAGAQVVLSSNTWLDLHDKVSRLQQILKDRRIFFFEETLAHDRELLKTLPGMGMRFDRYKVVTSNNAVDLLPLFNAGTGDRDPVMLLHTPNNQLYSYNPVERVRDNWNATVFGASGSGKSVIMNMLITNAMLSNATRGRLIVVDFAGANKSSYLMVSRLLGGRFIPFFGDGGARINPFPPPREALGPDGNIRGSTLNFLLVLTDILLANEGDDKDSHLFRVILQRAVTETYAGRAQDEAPRYQDLLEVLRGYQAHPEREADAPRVRVLVELLSGFLASPSAHLFNSTTTLTAREPFVIFDLFGIDSLPRNVAQAVTFVVCERVKNLAFDDQDARYKYVILDEVAQLIKRPAMVSLFDELYSTSRKHNTSVWTVTQNYGSYVKSSLATTVKLNSTSLVLLSHARDARARDSIAEDFDLNPREAALFRSLQTVKGEYSELLLKTEVYDPEHGKRPTCAKLRMRLSPFDYQLATSDALDREKQRHFIEANPDKPLVEVLEHVAKVAA
jgi:conjugal transfer ATP-binding protein TraC